FLRPELHEICQRSPEFRSADRIQRGQRTEKVREESAVRSCPSVLETYTEGAFSEVCGVVGHGLVPNL
ncbi:hypothetical protein PFISCL1PPCAC_16872, partial [Pristionchus fissidentatus]